jgi:hypothetical protein
MWLAAEHHYHRSVSVSIHCLSIINKSSPVVKIISVFILYSDMFQDESSKSLIIYDNLSACDCMSYVFYGIISVRDSPRYV